MDRAFFSLLVHNAITEVYAEAEFYDLTFSVRKEERSFEAETAEVPFAVPIRNLEGKCILAVNLARYDDVVGVLKNSLPCAVAVKYNGTPLSWRTPEIPRVMWTVLQSLER